LVVGAHYAASKAGVICFTKSLALQAAPDGINVNAVCPGPTKTPMTDAWGERANQEFAAKIPFKRYGEPEEIAEAILFLASERSRYITGEILDVNGGLIMD
jgi:NAD(P)-dependent dehydrogenase (short-subunit alcohol dehydrogenase family)